MMLSLQHLYPSWLSSSEVGASLSFLGLFRVSGVENPGVRRFTPAGFKLTTSVLEKATG